MDLKEQRRGEKAGAIEDLGGMQTAREVFSSERPGRHPPQSRAGRQAEEGASASIARQIGSGRVGQASTIRVSLRVSRLVEAVPEIAELDLNPVFALPPGQGCRIADARIRVRSAEFLAGRLAE
jgi:hypothetical protein